jgi:hypothetical protein
VFRLCAPRVGGVLRRGIPKNARPSGPDDNLAGIQASRAAHDTGHATDPAPAANMENTPKVIAAT